MLKRLFFVVLTAAIVVVATAEEVNQTPSLSVDLDKVVSTRVVQPVDGISSAGQPDKAAFKVFAEQGYTTVIDLRTKDEDRGLDEAVIISDLGMDYVVFPIEKIEEINFDNAGKLDELIAASKGPVLVHCASGNRVGALLALRRSLDGADDATVIAYGKEGGMTGLEDHVRDTLSKK
jgi:uncharacterized protein (TIGR01244 family)